VGYVGYRQALPVLLTSLERVTYRGYDSFGVAVLNGQGIEVLKRVGTVEEHCTRMHPLYGTLGIGHTRWATVGRVSVANAHPHLDCRSNFAIVHNGDIDNFHHLRQRLLGQGHTFLSETDSEVIAHLIEAQGGGDIVEATRRALRELEGSFAIVVLHRPTGQLVVARQGSPLVIGLGEGETFVASDVPALLPYTNRFVFLEDGDLALAWAGEFRIWHDDREAVRSVHQISWSADQISKGGYDHFMLKEICEQPQAIRDTLAAYPAHDGAGSPLDQLLPAKDLSRLVLLGCGTSYHAALLGEQFLSRLLSRPVVARVASEFQGVTSPAGCGLAIAFSQSGETSDTITALRHIKNAGYASLAVSNVMGSSITRIVDATLYTRAGPEVAVASTKTFLSQLAVLYLLGCHLATDREAVAMLPRGLKSLPGKVQEVLSHDEDLRRAARDLAKRQHLFIIAKGLDVPIALEGALKFKEVAYLHTEGYPAGELKHGPFAMLQEDTPVLAIVPADGDRTRMLTTIREVKARGAPVVAIAQQDDAETAQFADIILRIPNVDPFLAPVLHAVVLQLLSYYCALERGCPIDRPRNLAKSVTVP
jgi:glucosamine--fructose-6-phosphate aminotransferase (isomerizing)